MLHAGLSCDFIDSSGIHFMQSDGRWRKVQIMLEYLRTHRVGRGARSGHDIHWSTDANYKSL